MIPELDWWRQKFKAILGYRGKFEASLGCMRTSLKRRENKRIAKFFSEQVKELV